MSRTSPVRWPPAALLAVLLTAGCTGSSDADGGHSSAPSATASQLNPGPTPPAAPARLPATAVPGTVTLGTGPFDDRFEVTDLQLRDGAVDAVATITSDVSDVLVLEAVADFYDAAGALLGSVRQEHTPDHGAEEPAGPPDEAVELHLEAAEPWRAQVSSAVLSVPVLVNE